MSQKLKGLKDGAEATVRDIRRRTRKQYSAEEKIRIVLAGLRGEDSIAELCRREGISESLYYSWSKEFLEAGKKRLAGDTARQASSGEVKELRSEMRDLKEALAEQILENRLLKKSMTGDGGDGALGTPRPRSWRSSAWSNAPTCRSAARSTSWGFHRRRFTGGMTATGPSARPASPIAPAAPVGCGTGSRMTSAARSWTWPWTSPSCRPGSWP